MLQQGECSLRVLKRVKVAFAGDASVGKTSIIMKYLGVRDISQIRKTKGVSIENAKYAGTELIIWDFSGQEHFRDIIVPFLTGSHIVVLVFDLSETKTLYNLIDKWSEYVRKTLGSNIPTIIVGNKRDIKRLSDDFIQEAIQKIRKKINVLLYLETSAVTGEGISTLFDKLFQYAQAVQV